MDEPSTSSQQHDKKDEPTTENSQKELEGLEENVVGHNHDDTEKTTEVEGSAAKKKDKGGTDGNVEEDKLDKDEKHGKDQQHEVDQKEHKQNQEDKKEHQIDQKEHEIEQNAQEKEQKQMKNDVPTKDNTPKSINKRRSTTSTAEEYQKIVNSNISDIVSLNDDEDVSDKGSYTGKNVQNSGKDEGKRGMDNEKDEEKGKGDKDGEDTEKATASSSKDADTSRDKDSEANTRDFSKNNDTRHSEALKNRKASSTDHSFENLSTEKMNLSFPPSTNPSPSISIPSPSTSHSVSPAPTSDLHVESVNELDDEQDELDPNENVIDLPVIEDRKKNANQKKMSIQSDIWTVRFDDMPMPVENGAGMGSRDLEEIQEKLIKRRRTKEAVESALGHAKSWFHTVYEVLWRLLELHAVRLVLLIVVILSVKHFCALNFIAICLVVIGVCLPSITRLICVFICAYLALEFLARQVYQMHFIPKDALEIRCDEFNMTQKLSTWIGLEDTPNSPSGDILLMILTIALIGVTYAIKYRQRHYRLKYGLPMPPPGIVFPEAIDIKIFDRNLVDGFKVAVNYFFYKFGLEMALIVTVVDAWFRMDLIATLMLMWVFVFCMSRRSICRLLWPFYLLFCAFLLPYQYAMAVGMPQATCYTYPWQSWLSKESLNENLLQFLDLASYSEGASSHFVHQIVFDFILLLFVASQEFTFRIESSEHPASNNNSIYRTGEFVLHHDNPHYDFVAEQRSFVDYIKIAIFMYGHWLTMIMVLAAGLGGTSLFALGYLVLAFAMLWQGNNLYIMRNYRKTLTKWYILMAYNIVAMLWKVALQVLACVWVEEFKSQDLCSVRQLFSIVCVDKTMAERLTPDDKCIVPSSETKIGFDTLAFIFLVFQIRILHSYFFQRCMVDFRCEIIQSSRGAILINQLVDKQMREQYQNQVKKFKEIAVRAKEIRKQYEEQFKNAGRNYFVPETYAQAKRAGDFYMFNYDPHTEDITCPEELYVPEVLGEPRGKLDPAQLIHTAVNKDMDLKGTLEAVAEAEKIVDEERRMIEAVREDPEGMKKKLQKLSQARRERIEKAAQLQPCSSDDLRETEDGLEMKVRTPSEPSESSSEEDVEEEKQPKQFVDYLYSALKFVLKILTALLHLLSEFFNRYSREHRYVAYVLDKEKIRLKHTMPEVLYDANQTTQNLRAEWKKRGLQIVASAEDVGRVEEEAQARWEQRHVVTKFVISYVSFITAYTHIVCYIFAAWAHAYCGGLITLPLPLMVFFWGSLCNPRPPKFFWICMILYTEFVIIIKFVCQFGFVESWQKSTDDSWRDWHYVLGIQQMAYFSLLDVALLVALFAHRYMLRRIGLWKDANTAETFVDENGSPKRNGSPVPQIFDMDKIKLDLSETPNEEEQQPKEERKEPTTAVGRFFDALLHPRIRYIRDFYPYIFFLDIICVLILTFQYQSFGELSSEQLSLLASSRVPLMFVVMLFISIIMIIIERALYLRKAVFWKLMYHVILIFLLHVWVMVVLPSITQKRVVNNKPAQFFYMVKCLQLLVSAWQLRNGYPRLCTGNLLTHSYGVVNYGLFYVFLMLPFVFELRTMIDWTWTDTTMPIFDFIKMEMFYAKIYVIKCARVLEQNFPVPRGVPRGTMIKYMYGIPGIFGVIILMLSPLLAFALLNRIGDHLTPQNMKMHVSLEGFPPIYQMSAQGIDMVEFTESQKENFKSAIDKMGYKPDRREYTRRAISFLGDYEEKDIYRVKLRPESDVWWPISTESLNAMYTELNKVNKENKTLYMNIHIEFQRVRQNVEKEPSVHSNDYQIALIPHHDGTQGLADQLANAIATANGTTAQAPVVLISAALPYFVVVPNEGQLRETQVLEKVIQDRDKCQGVKLPIEECLKNQTFLDFQLQLFGSHDHKSFLWKIQPLYKDLANFSIPHDQTDYDQYNKLKYVELVAFVDRVFPPIFSKFTQGGIMAMYFAVVYLGARLLRSVITSEPTDVIVQEMPNPDYLLKVCQDIYLVREARDFILEEDLFAKLIFLFRSPATLIKWTRAKIKPD
ncbi:unnamed protein product [Bursaphelenchus okinawaensis]|uniref:Piezo-type mechanosensitive ion channel component n=1 Tax=Bursaphelenchus okinawaensis TaxID=465554 RepID=A0A811KXX9_9BILA|nr:unnamed protein product [Bursaphelenchus okinawaensis]CAG9115205.1 unnamed protein product [Bursaphelenchus okinawaensis]